MHWNEQMAVAKVGNHVQNNSNGIEMESEGEDADDDDIESLIPSPKVSY